MRDLCAVLAALLACITVANSTWAADDPSPEAASTAAPAAAIEGAAGGAAPAEAPKPLTVTQRPEAIEAFLQLYLQTYSKHLKSPDWIARSMAVIGLAMIDDPRTTNLIVGVMEEDKSPIVRIYAWEALHARQARMNAQQRALWKRRGFELAEQNLLRGDLRLGLVGLIAEDGPTAEGKRWLKRIFATTNSINPSDIRTLYAVGDTIEAWQSGDMVLWLIKRMAMLNDAYRAELVLQRVCQTIEPHQKLRRESSDTMWATTGQRWMAWYRKQKLKEVSPRECPKYTGAGEVMPPGEKITDTADPRWRRDLELPRFHLDQLDVGLALDTTASMRAPLEWIKRDVVKMMRAFELISREPRIGITLYRDQGDEYVTRTIPLTSKAEEVRARLENERPKGGGDVPEAVYDALVEMVQHQKWSPSPQAKKIIVVMGDAPPKEDSLEKIKALVTAARERGFSFHAIKVATSKYIERRLKLPNYDRPLTTFDRIAEWGGGTSTRVEFWEQSNKHPRWIDTARPTEGNQADRVILRQVLRAALNDSYRERVDPFIGVLLEYVEEPIKEVREPFPVAPPPSPVNPRDPQQRR